MLAEKGQGIKQKFKQTKKQPQRQEYGDYQRERGKREVEEGEGRVNGDERKFDLGW